MDLALFSIEETKPLFIDHSPDSKAYGLRRIFPSINNKQQGFHSFIDRDVYYDIGNVDNFIVPLAEQVSAIDKLNSMSEVEEAIKSINARDKFEHLKAWFLIVGLRQIQPDKRVAYYKDFVIEHERGHLLRHIALDGGFGPHEIEELFAELRSMVGVSPLLALFRLCQLASQGSATGVIAFNYFFKNEENWIPGLIQIGKLVETNPQEADKQLKQMAAELEGILSEDFNKEHLDSHPLGGGAVWSRNPAYFFSAHNWESRFPLYILGSLTFFSILPFHAFSWAALALWLFYSIELLKSSPTAAAGRLLNIEVILVGALTATFALIPGLMSPNWIQAVVLVVSVESVTRIHRVMNQVVAEARVLTALAQKESGVHNRDQAAVLIQQILAHDDNLSQRLARFGKTESIDSGDVIASFNQRLHSKNPLMRFFARVVLARLLKAQGIPITNELLSRLITGMSSHPELLRDSLEGKNLVLFLPHNQVNSSQLAALAALLGVFRAQSVVLTVEKQDEDAVKNIMAARLGQNGHVSTVVIDNGSYQTSTDQNSPIVLNFNANDLGHFTATVNQQSNATFMSLGNLAVTGVDADNELNQRFKNIQNLLDLLPKAGITVEEIMNPNAIVAAMVAA